MSTVTDAILTPSGRSVAATPIDRLLQAVRSHLGLEVAYLSEFTDTDIRFRFVDAPGLEHMIKPGDTIPLDQAYCPHILAGRLPELIEDTSTEPLAMSIPVTEAAPIGCHISVPIRFPDGEAFGMFCCLSPDPRPDMGERDLSVLRAMADMAGHQLFEDMKGEREMNALRAEVTGIIDNDGLSMHFQPIFDLARNTAVGFEALSRFDTTPPRAPDKWFFDAARCGMAETLEVHAIRRALAEFRDVPGRHYISVNASPDVIVTDLLHDTLAGFPCENILLEVTEHTEVADYEAFHRKLEPLRYRGIQVAVDDAGAGFASLSHIVKLRPDVIKLDLSLTQGIEANSNQRAIASALSGYAREVGVRMIAEGVETTAELETLRKIGVGYGQGYLLGRPQRLGEALRLAG